MTEDKRAERFSVKSKTPTDAPRSKARELLSWVICLCSAVAVALLLRQFVFELAVVKGSSMANTLFDKETVFVEKISKLSDNFDIGDILIVHYPNSSEAFVKRIVGLPGDTIEVSDGYLYRNGERIDEPFIRDGYVKDDFERITVPEECVFVMGDNRNNSTDSRDPNVGPIAFDDIVGHALAVIFPFSAIRPI